MLVHHGQYVAVGAGASLAYAGRYEVRYKRTSQKLCLKSEQKRWMYVVRIHDSPLN